MGRCWFVAETDVKVAGRWRDVYRVVDRYGQVIDVFISSRRDIPAVRRLSAATVHGHGERCGVITDRAGAFLGVVDELLSGVFHNTA
jgi:transposase, IS6 family